MISHLCVSFAINKDNNLCKKYDSFKMIIIPNNHISFTGVQRRQQTFYYFLLSFVSIIYKADFNFRFLSLSQANMVKKDTLCYLCCVGRCELNAREEIHG